MKVALEVKSNKKLIKPRKDDIIIFDGKDWYITTRNDIFSEYEARIDKKMAEFCDKMDRKISETEEINKETLQFKQEISQQIVDISDIVRELVETQGEK